MVTGNSIHVAASSELPGHCRQHTLSAREDPRSAPISDRPRAARLEHDRNLRRSDRCCPSEKCPPDTFLFASQGFAAPVISITLRRE